MTELSRNAEGFVCSWLIHRGWAVLDRNFRTRIGEIDIIAIRDDIMIFVEVKFAMDGSATLPLHKIDLKKQSRISSTAQVYISRNPPPDQIRFDVAVVGGRPDLFRMTTYLEDAFRPDPFQL